LLLVVGCWLLVVGGARAEEEDGTEEQGKQNPTFGVGKKGQEASADFA
jgi:hypothetical protein